MLPLICYTINKEIIQSSYGEGDSTLNPVEGSTISIIRFDLAGDGAVNTAGLFVGEDMGDAKDDFPLLTPESVKSDESEAALDLDNAGQNSKSSSNPLDALNLALLLVYTGYAFENDGDTDEGREYGFEDALE
jgi:hypothetical protein